MKAANTAKTISDALGPVVVIDPNKQMQGILRAMLAAYGVRAVRTFADTERAATAMLTEPPSLILIDWESGPLKAPRFLKLFRHQNMFPVCLVPIIVLFSEARQQRVERALRLGAQAVLVKPLSPAALIERVGWLLAGGAHLTLSGDRYVVKGIEGRLKEERARHNQLKAARKYQAAQFAEMVSIQDNVDRIMDTAF